VGYEKKEIAKHMKLPPCLEHKKVSLLISKFSLNVLLIKMSHWDATSNFNVKIKPSKLFFHFFYAQLNYLQGGQKK